MPSPLPCILRLGVLGARLLLHQIEIIAGNFASMLQSQLALNNQTTQENTCVGLALKPMVLEHSSLRSESLVAGEVFVLLLSNSQASKLSFSNFKILISASGQVLLLEHPSQVDSNEDSQFCCLSGLWQLKRSDLVSLYLEC